MDRKNFLTTIWKERLLPVALLLLVLVIICLVSIVGKHINFFSSSVNINGEGLGAFFVELIAKYWPWLVLIFGPTLLAFILTKLLPGSYHKAVETTATWLTYIAVLSAFAWMMYGLYLRKEYGAMIFASGYVVISYINSYFKKKAAKKAQALTT